MEGYNSIIHESVEISKQTIFPNFMIIDREVYLDDIKQTIRYQSFHFNSCNVKHKQADKK